MSICVFATTPLQQVSGFSGFCVATVSSFLCVCCPLLCYDKFLVSTVSVFHRFHHFCSFVVRFPASTSFLLPRCLRLNSLFIPALLLSTSPFQSVACFSGFCVSPVSSWFLFECPRLGFNLHLVSVVSASRRFHYLRVWEGRGGGIQHQGSRGGRR